MSKKFYKRFQFESAEMTENEVSDRYRSRFSNYNQVNQYIEEILIDAKEDAITLNVVVIPSNIEHRLVDASNYDEIEKLESIQCKSSFNDMKLPNNKLHPFSHGLTSKYNNDTQEEKLQIHRNGCIQYICYYKRIQDSTIPLPDIHMVKKLMQILQFANTVLSNYNYFGDVKIISTLKSSSNSVIPHREKDFVTDILLDTLNIVIEREHPMFYVETKYEQITSSIMNEIFNHYGDFRCPSFDEEGNYVCVS